MSVEKGRSRIREYSLGEKIEMILISMVNGVGGNLLIGIENKRYSAVRNVSTFRGYFS